jgi:hypothetical protein
MTAIIATPFPLAEVLTSTVASPISPATWFARRWRKCFAGGIPAAKQDQVDAGSKKFPDRGPGIFGRRLASWRMYDVDHRKAARGQGADAHVARDRRVP